VSAAKRGGRGGTGKGGPPGGRLTVKVKTAGKRTASSARWLERQLNDPYVAEARRLGYRSRAAFKLAQLDDRFGLIALGARVVDLGAAPGGWTQVAVERSHAREGRGRVVAVDMSPMEPIAGAEILELDFLAPEAPERIRAALGGPADLVMSDMAAPATGHPQTDHLRIMALAEAAYAFAGEVLAPGGAFLAKVLRGGAEKQLLDALKRDFATVRHVKPPASRADSAEIYVVATGFRGRGAGQH
jgi:23S rRNA (uridine2552-2'-O)-methyltransferase